MRSTFCRYVPFGLPGLRPSALNCDCMYATALSSPGVPGARPSIESAERSLMCCSSPSAEIALLAVSTAPAATRVSPEELEQAANRQNSAASGSAEARVEIIRVRCSCEWLFDQG